MAERAPNAEELAREFLVHRPRLLGIAYRMLGSMWDAEDVVADAMVRWLDVERNDIREPAAFLTTMVTRRALDQLRSARVTRERYIGPWLPEPVRTDPSPLDPLDTVERRETVSLATLRMLERLTPPERAVFVLHEAFELPHAEIAEALHISPAGSRQHLHRARSRIGATDRRYQSANAVHHELLESMLGALEGGDLHRLQDVLTAEVVAYSDGGGNARAASRPLVGAARIIKLFDVYRRRAPVRVERRVEVNGRPGALLWFGRQYQLLALDVRDDSVREIYSIMNPAKLRYLGHQLGEPPTSRA